jgi:hypothetical protein
MKVQCISNNSGFHQRLEIGKWYQVEESAFLDDSGNTVYYIVQGLGKNDEYGVYDKSLFITVEEVRNKKLGQLGIN